MSLLQLSDDVLVDIFNSYLGNAKALKLLGNRSLNCVRQHFLKTTLVPEDNLFPYSILSIIDCAQECMHEQYINYKLMAKYGALESLKWARSQADPGPWDEETCTNATSGGHLEVVKWLYEDGAPWYKRTCAYAAEGGHLDVLQWARANGARWDEFTCANAASGGHLDVLKWARQNGAPWDEDTCANAAYGGHLDVLKWARQNGAPWDEETCACADENGHLDVLKWARENGAPWNEFVHDFTIEDGFI